MEEEEGGSLLVKCGSAGGSSGGVAAAAPKVVDGSSRGGGHIKRRRGMNRDWSGLPEPAVYLVLRSLMPVLADLFSLGSVCRAWRSVFAACKRELFLSMPPLIYDRGSSPAALGSLYNPAEGRCYRRKEPMEWTWPSAKSSALSTMIVMGASYGYWIVTPGVDLVRKQPPFLVDPFPGSPGVRINLPIIAEFIFSAVMTAPLGSPNCMVIASGYGWIRYCRPGRDDEWTCMAFAPPSKMFNYDANLMAVVGGKIYALIPEGKVQVFEMSPQLSVTDLDVQGQPRPERGSCVLTVTDGEILCITHVCNGDKLCQYGRVFEKVLDGSCCGSHRLVVRRLDLRARRWVTVDTLGRDRAFFFTERLMCRASTWGGSGDCVYDVCPYAQSLVVLHLKDGRTEHYPSPYGHVGIRYLFPSFCYEHIER